jgi:hypothetical protein
MNWTLIATAAGVMLIGGLAGLAVYFIRGAMRASE